VIPRAALVALAALAPAHVLAHGFGLRYDLPLPLSLYLAATAAAIVLSFVVVGVFMRRAPLGDDYLHVDLLRGHRGRIAAARALAGMLRSAALALALVTVAAGFVGNPDPYRNIAPTMVWINFWVGMAYVSAFVGNLWMIVNPWRTLYAWAESLHRRMRPGHAMSMGVAYPEALGVWPAFALLYVFSWTELVYPSPAVPLHIAWLAVAYSLVTWAGMAIFGRETWLARGELFSVLFTLLARFAPSESRIIGGAVCAACTMRCGRDGAACVGCGECLARARTGEWTVALRPFAAGLVDRRPSSTSMTAFVLLVLSTVLYDGILGTPEWGAFEALLSGVLHASGEVAAIAIRTIGLGVFWAIFFGAYVAVCALMSALVARRYSTWSIACSLALTLVPIAIAYHFAHYVVYLLVQGQYIVPLLSDPFGRGWNLFGTAGYHVDVGIVGARFEWYAAVSAIIVGHIVAVYLAHARALAVFDSRAAALRSQVPLTALMVVYTFVSLSILAEPITEQRPSAQPVTSAGGAIEVPADAILPVAGGDLQPVGPGHTARAKLGYRILGSTFQDGSPMTFADIAYAYAFAWRWGARTGGDDPHYDPAIDAATATMRARLAGVRFSGVDTTSKSFRVDDVNVVRQLFLVDVYTTTPVDEPEQDAAVAPPWSTLPWHVLALMDAAVSAGDAAFSESEAKRRGVEWLDLARSPRLLARLAALTEAFARDGYRPQALVSLVSADDARKRWNALLAFYRAHGHFLVTNGPYVLKAWTADSATVDVVRDLTYPLGVGSFDSYAVPRRGFVAKVSQVGNALDIAADVETIDRHARSYDIVRVPLDTLSPGDLTRAAPQCRYMVLDANGGVALAGAADPGDDRRFRIDFAGRLAAGRYTAVVEITVDGNAANADIRRIPVVIAASP
jgi:hypothetical protein